MAPNARDSTGVLSEEDAEITPEQIEEVHKTSKNRHLPLVWRDVIKFAVLHALGFYGFYLMFTSARIWTSVLVFINYHLGILGITAGAHRLWAHKAYKARWPLKLFLAYIQTLAFQFDIIFWAKYHRVHHKYTETDADPHNAKRGFFYSHMGWTMVKKNPEFETRCNEIDLSDLYSDPIVNFQYKYYYQILFVVFLVVPTFIPMYFWNETFVNAFCLNLSRYLLSLHCTWLVNSAAHLYGNKPYDKSLYSSENFWVTILVNGEGWHNYHHAFPWDYKASELGIYSTNMTAFFIDAMAKLGLAYDLKSVAPEVVKRRVERTGDGSHPIWGWGDKDQSEEDKRSALISHKDT
uniref:Delta 12 acylCoA desaturase/acetylenase n=1 Tax=Chauliognathus lugubris TaxID=1184608 RepID=K7PD28_9COLE|nr:delta 12 acylCoA desaturase/acetylenase [Chauliognathus lugubris]